jgi:AcrR family transcriptional regulator
VASACDVSEKTIYNYFPTKESLILDREEDMANDIRRTLGPGAAQISPVEATVQVLTSQIHELFTYWDGAGATNTTMFKRFIDLIEETPALRTAQADMIDRLTQVAAESMAARAAVDPDDPEPQIAANALMGLWRIYFRAVVKYADDTRKAAEVRDAVIKEVQRAARLIDTGLWSFAVVVQGAKSREQLLIAAEASDEARRQVVLAIKQARSAWRQIKDDLHHQVHEGRDQVHAARNAKIKEVRQAAQKKRREVQQSRQQIRRQSR